MFTVRSYDFGTVARGAKTEYAFEVTNPYVEDVHITGVRVSCGCTTPRLEKETIKTYEKGAIIAHINSDRYLGSHRASITVTFDKPYFAEVQLQVRVYVYSDVLLQPASVAFGNVQRGTADEQSLEIRYAGRSDWKIVNVRSDNPHLTGRVTEKTRRGGSIVYELTAVLDQSAPAGDVNDTLWLVTNDARKTNIPVPVEGRIVNTVSVAPESLFLGTVAPGQTLTKRLVVRGHKPFRITSITSDSPALHAAMPENAASKTVFLVPVTFTAPDNPGRVIPTLQIATDASEDMLTVTAHAVVRSP